MIPGPKHRRLLTVGAETLARSIRGAERRGGRGVGRDSPPHERRWRGSRSDARHHPVGLTACGETHAAQFSRWGLERRSIPPKQPVVKPTRPSSPGGGSAGDPSRLNRVATRRSSLRFGRNTPGPVLPVGAPPSRALSAGRLAPTGRTGRSRRSPGFHQRLLAPRIRRMQGAGVLFRRVARCRGACPSGRFPSRRGLNAEIWRRGAPPGRGVGRGFPSPRERVGRIAKRFSTPPRGVSAPHPKNAGSRCAFSPGGAMRGACPSGRFPSRRGLNAEIWRRGAPPGRGVGRGFPSPRERVGRIAKRFSTPPRGLAPRIRRMQGAGVLFRRVARCRGACPSGRFPSRRGLNAEIWRRGAPPGRGVGKGFPSPRERVGRIAKRFSTPPRGVSAPHAKNAGSRCAFSPGGAMPGCLPLGEIPLPARTQCRDLAARSAAGEGCGEGFPLPA